MWDMTVSDMISVISGMLALMALGVAIFAIRKGNRNSSVATLVTMNEAFRQAWQRFIYSKGPARDYEWSELMNLLEIACGIVSEGSLTGVSRELSSEFIANSLHLLGTDPDASRLYSESVHDPTTYRYIRKFRKKMRESGKDTAMARLRLSRVSSSSQP